MNKDTHLVRLAREAREGDTHASVELERRLKDLVDDAEELVHQTVLNRPAACGEIGDELIKALLATDRD